MFKNDKGSAMPVALLVMLVLTVLGTALWQYFMADTLQVARAGQQMQSYYLSRSGVEVGLGMLENVMHDSSTEIRNINDLISELGYEVAPISDIDTGTFDVQFQYDTIEDKIVISSTGNVNGLEQEEFATVDIHFPNITVPPYWLNPGDILNATDTPQAPADMTGEVAFVSAENQNGHGVQAAPQHTAILRASFISFIDVAGPGSSPPPHTHTAPEMKIARSEVRCLLRVTGELPRSFFKYTR
jgi:hypothetical protein